MLACHEEYCSARVPKVMQPDGRQPGFLQERLEVPAQEVRAAHGRAGDGSKHEPVILPQRVTVGSSFS
jgi:hypothetical protein